MKENIVTKYSDAIAQAYLDVMVGKFNKTIIENNEVRIVVYKCGIIIRIDIKEL